MTRHGQQQHLRGARAYAQASLLRDGARIPLRSVATTLGVAPSEAAWMVALGRLAAAEGIVVVPRGCRAHLAGAVARGTPLCPRCQHLAATMHAGAGAARQRWVVGPDRPAEPPRSLVHPTPAAVPPVPVRTATASTAVPPPPGPAPDPALPAAPAG